MFRQNLEINNIYSQLRQAIDQGRLAEIRDIFDNHPDLDWNAITPNKLSALWWALIPPTDKVVSREMINLLLSFSRNDRPVINPSQTYAKLRPDYYYKHFISLNNPDDKAIISAIEHAQIRFEEFNGHQEAAPLARDDHGASNPVVMQASDESLKRLYHHYHTQVNVNHEIHDMESFMAKAEFKKSFSVLHQDQIHSGLDRIKRDVDIRSGMNINEGPSTLKEALSLIWRAAKESDPHYVDGSPFDRQKALFEAIYEAQSAYGPDKPSCWAGTWGRIGTSLCGMHKDVYYQKDVELTGEFARGKYLAIVGRTLDRIYTNNRAIYWAIIRTSLLPKSSPRDEATYLDWFENTLIPTLKNELYQANVSQMLTKTYIEELMILNSVPLSQHSLSNQLTLLQQLFQKDPQKFNEILIGLETQDLNEVCGLLKNQYLQMMIPPQDMPNQTTRTIEQIKLDVINKFLHEKNNHGDITINKLWEITRVQIKLQDSNLQKWFQELSIDKQLIFIQEVPQNNIHHQTIFPFAVKYACLKNIPLKNMNLCGCDFRGWDFRGWDLSEVNLSNSDLRLITAEGAKWDECDLRDAQFNQWLLPEALLGSRSSKSASFLKKEHINGDTVFHWAIKHHENDIVLRILASTYCTTELLMTKNNRFETGLHCAIQQNELDIVKKIVASPLCTELVLKTTNNRETPLQTALSFDHFEAAKVIIDSLYCTTAVLLAKVPRLPSSTALSYAIRKERVDVVQKIILSPYCTEEVLIGNDKGLPFDKPNLHLAVKKNNLMILQILIGSSHCTSDVLMIKNSTNKTALDLAFEENREDMIATILSSSHCLLEMLAPKNNYGHNSTALHWAIQHHRFDLALSLLNSSSCTQDILMAKDDSGKTALDYATQYDQKKLIKRIIFLENQYKANFIGHLPALLKNMNRSKILDLFDEIKNKNGKYSYIHRQENPKWDKLRLLLKSPHTDNNALWHTTTFIKSVNLLKGFYFEKKRPVDAAYKQKEEDFLSFLQDTHTPIQKINALKPG